jgi:hypothetical protein
LSRYCSSTWSRLPIEFGMTPVSLFLAKLREPSFCRLPNG